MGIDRIRELLQLAQRIHAGQTDGQGKPYIEHLLAVARAVSEPAKPVALLHDAIEDHPETLTELERTLTIVELTAVLLLTRRPGDTYAEYIERIATWPGQVGEIGREVKTADVEHNLGRLPASLERLRPRYTAALERLRP